MVRRVDFVGCAANTGSMLIEGDQLERACRATDLALQPRDAIGRSRRAGRRRVIEITAGAGYAMNFFGRVDRLKQIENARVKSVAAGRRAAFGPLPQLIAAPVRAAVGGG